MKPSTPAPVALAAVKAGPPATPPEKQQRISPKVRQAIELLATGKARTQLEAAEKVGMARETVSRALAKPHVIEHMRQRAVRTIAMAAPRASERMVELVDCDSLTTSYDASKHVLAIAGIKPDPDGSSINVNVAIKAGWVIDISEPDDRQPMRTISPE